MLVEFQTSYKRVSEQSRSVGEENQAFGAFEGLNSPGFR